MSQNSSAQQIFVGICVAVLGSVFTALLLHHLGLESVAPSEQHQSQTSPQLMQSRGDSGEGTPRGVVASVPARVERQWKEVIEDQVTIEAPPSSGKPLRVDVFMPDHIRNEHHLTLDEARRLYTMSLLPDPGYEAIYYANGDMNDPKIMQYTTRIRFGAVDYFLVRSRNDSPARLWRSWVLHREWMTDADKR